MYETNVASCRTWDGLGFKRIGRVPGCGQLKSYPDRFVDAIIFGRDFARGEEENEELVSEERFEMIKFYLRHGKYPNRADRAEKSRLRSAATHYKLLENDVLMLKDKEVISDPARQYEIARQTHALGQHAGINKTTATITEKYHWRGIKDTVLDVIRVCGECEDKSNNGMVKPGTPNQTSAQQAPPHVPAAASVSLSAKDASSQARRGDMERRTQSNCAHQATTAVTSFGHDIDEPPIDPQIMNPVYGDQHATHMLNSGYSPNSCLDSHSHSYAEMDVDPECHALQQLLNAPSPRYEEGNGGISDADFNLEYMSSGVCGARMEVDSSDAEHYPHG